MATLNDLKVGDHFTFPNESVVYSVRELRDTRTLCAAHLEGFTILPLHVFSVMEVVVPHAASHNEPQRAMVR